MRIDFDVVMHDFLHGNAVVTTVIEAEVRDAQGKVTKEAVTGPATLAAVAAEALAFTDPQARETGTQKMRAGELAMKVYKGGIVELSVEDVSLIKEKIGVVWGPVMVVQAYKALDPEPPVHRIGKSAA